MTRQITPLAPLFLRVYVNQTMYFINISAFFPSEGDGFYQVLDSGDVKPRFQARRAFYCDVALRRVQSSTSPIGRTSLFYVYMYM
jgi:hypothetical protein